MIAVDQCSKDPVCHQVEYAMVATVELNDVTMNTYCHDFDSDACISVSFTNPIAENIISKSSYDFQSLIGEIGGTLGLFLGLSGLGLMEMLNPTKKWLVVLMKIITLLLLIAFAVYATQSIIKYFTESLATTVNFIRGNMTEEFPFLTFCPGAYGSESFHDKIRAEITLNPFLNMSTLTNEWSSLYSPYDLFSQPYLYNNANGQKIQLESNNIWSKVFDKYYGLCYTLDIRKQPSLDLGIGPITFGTKFICKIFSLSKSIAPE